MVEQAGQPQAGLSLTCLQTLVRFSGDKAHIVLKLVNRDKSSVCVPWVPKDRMSRVMRQPTFCICENKDTDKLRGYREADQRLCFRYIDSTIPLLSIHEISSL